MMKLLRTYLFAIVLTLVIIGVYFVNPSTGKNAFVISLSNLKEMLTFLPPIFIFVGLLDVWVPKETMIKLMGKDSGIKGILIAFILGSAAAGPLYAAFPIAVLLLKKGARLAYVIFFLGAWSSTKIPLVLYETTSLGIKFTAIHISVSITGFLLSAFLIEKMASKQSVDRIYNKAHSLN